MWRAPPSHDCQREVGVDEFARAAAPAEQTRSDSSWSAMRRLCLHKATLVGSQHNRGEVPTVRQGDESRVEGGAAKANTAHYVQTTTGSDMAVWHEKDKESATLRGILAILCAAVPEEGASNQNQGGAANFIRPRTANLGIKVSSSPVVQRGETEAHRGRRYSTRRLESTKKRAAAVIFDTKLEMSQRCELAMKMPTRHDSLDVKMETSPQRVSTKRPSR